MAIIAILTTPDNNRLIVTIIHKIIVVIYKSPIEIICNACLMRCTTRIVTTKYTV